MRPCLPITDDWGKADQSSTLAGPKDAVAHGLVVVEIDQPAHSAVRALLNKAQAESLQGLEQFELVIKDEASGRPGFAVGAVNRSFHATA